MGFSSQVFLFIFFPSVCIIYYLLTQIKWKEKLISRWFLLLSSFVFYMWGSIQTFFTFLLIILYVFLMGKLIEKTRKDGVKYMVIAVLVVAVNLINVKYLKQIDLQLKLSNSMLGASFLKLVLTPIGVSFMSFEAISYFVDIYRGDAESGSFLDTALFLAFFPKLISGPIVLWKDFKPQIRTADVSLEKLERGITRMIFGYAKKVLIADSLGQLLVSINTCYATGMGPGILWMKAFVYAFQLYYDFSGYSDMAIGLSLILGYGIKENFDHPYASSSVSEFWRRWHMSLGSWFREYIYFPMGGSRRGNTYLNLFTVFLLTGIWHGDSWAFVWWGVLHGLAVVFERLCMKREWYKRIPKLIKWFLTMVYVFTLWILFQSVTVKEFNETITMMFSHGPEIKNYALSYFITPKNVTLLVLAAFFSVAGAWKWTAKLKEQIGKSVILSFGWRVVLLVLFTLSVITIVNSSYSPFLYFQF